MVDSIGYNSTQFLQLDNDIRITSNSTFNAQDAYENAFEDVLLDVISTNIQEQEEKNKVNFSNLGPPAGFFLDTSLLSEEDSLEVYKMGSA